MTKTVLLLIASQGYEPTEYGTAKQALKEAGFNVVTISNKMGEAVAKDNTTTNVDMLLDDATIDSGDGLYIIGGPGAVEFLDNGKVHKLLQEWKNTGKPYGAICISPRILAKAGVLRGKKATGWNGDGNLSQIFNESGVEYDPQAVIIDGNVITGSGPQASEEFGKAIVGNV